MYRGSRGRARGGPRGKSRGRGRGDTFNGPPRVGRSPPRRRRSPESDSRENPYCIFCKVQLISKKAMNEHKEVATHKQKENLVRKAITDGLHYCYTCEKIFGSKMELDAHCLMSRHQPLYRVEGIETNFQEEKEEEKSLTETEKRRVEDDKDRQKIVMKLNELKENDSGDSRRSEHNRRNYCKLCLIDCISDSNYKAHCESWRHRAEVDRRKEQEARKQVEQEMEKKYNEIDGQNENGKADDYIEGNKMHVPSNLTTYSRFWCELCSVGMTDDNLYLQHVRGRKHMRTVSQMKRPYKCYVCHMTYTVEQDFNNHLESKAHIDKAFRKSIPKGTAPDKDSTKRGSRDRQRDESRDRKRPSDTDRKVEIIKSPMTETGDLRDKLQGKTNIVITKTNSDPEKKDSDKEKNQYGPKLPKADGDSKIDDANAVNKRAKEMEFEVKFRKLVREYGNNLRGLKERLTKDREKDIATYQQFETTYSKLCREEDYVRENIRLSDEGDPRKEEYIRDMIRIQNDMREVRQELEIREMMIIKRESLFREKFQDVDNKVVIKPQADPEKPEENKKQSELNKEVDEKQSDDLRVQLERERLLKRLGPELNSLDPILRDKLLSAIMDEKKELAKEEAKTANKVDSEEKKKQMAMLTEREKQLQKELAALKSNSQAASKKKITKSLVPQYDDVDEKKDGKKKSSQRSRPKSSDSSDSSSSSSDDEHYRKDRRRRRRSRSSSRYNSKTSDRNRKKRSRRSSSRERDRKKKSSKRSHDSRSGRKDDKKKVKLTIKSKESNKVTHTANPLVIGDSSGSDQEKEKQYQQQTQRSMPPPQQQIPTSSNIIPIISGGESSAPTMLFQQQQRAFFSEPVQTTTLIQQQVPPPQKREQFSFWKNPAITVNQVNTVPQKDSPKEDVWDIAFTGGAKPQREEEIDDSLSRLFDTNADSPKTLPDQILNILRTVAPTIQDVPNQQQVYPKRESLPQNQFPVPIPKEKEKPPSSFPSMGRPEYFQETKPPTAAPSFSAISQSAISTAAPETSGGRIRSILKKMKDPPDVPLSTTNTIPAGRPSLTLKKPTTGATSTMSLLASSTRETAIPGLDISHDDKTHERENNSSSSHGYSHDDHPERKPLGTYQQPYKDDRPTTSYAQSASYSDRYDIYGPPQTSTAPISRAYVDPYGKPPLERRSPPRERPPTQYGVPPSRDFGERRPPPDADDRRSLTESYDRDVESYRRLEESGRGDGRLPPAGRMDPYARDPLPSAAAREREPLPPPREREPPRFDEPLVPPSRRPGESEDEFYLRFERYYEEKRRREADLARRSYPPPSVRGYEADARRYPLTLPDKLPSAPYAERRRDDRYDERYYRRPPAVVDLTRDRQLPPSQDRYRDPLPSGRDPRDYRAGLERSPVPHDRRSFGSDDPRYPSVARRTEEQRRSFPEDGRRAEDDRRRNAGDIRRLYEGEGRRPDDHRSGEPVHERRQMPPSPQDARRQAPPTQDARRPPNADDARRLKPLSAQDARSLPVPGKNPVASVGENKVESKPGIPARPPGGMINRGIPLNSDGKTPAPRGPPPGQQPRPGDDLERRQSVGPTQRRYDDRYRPY